VPAIVIYEVLYKYDVSTISVSKRCRERDILCQ
jgi:hypothetical protein